MINKQILMVGLGHIQVSKTPGTIIKAMALGSCVGLVVIAPRYRTVGMVHIVLPDSKIDKDRASITPGYFADTGIQALMDEFKKRGVHNRRDMIIKIAGGARVMAANNSFDIGKRNVLASKKQLWQCQMAPLAEDIGASYSRTMWVEVDTGRVFIESPGRGRWEL